MTLKHYEKIGQLEGALSQHADEVYEQLTQLNVPDNPQQIIEILFRRLCERDKARRDTRSPVRLEEVARLADLSSWQSVVPVVDIFRQPNCCFLTPPTHIALNAESIIDISHESFIRLWKRLQKWLEAETHSAEIYRRLAENAILWKQGNIGLLRTPELENALAWYDRVKPNVQWANRYGKHFDLAMRFLSESETEKKREQKEKKAKQQKELEQAQKLAATRQQALEQAHKISVFQKQKLFGAMIALTISIALFFWALSARQEAISAQQQEKIAKQQALNEKEKRTIGLFESKLKYATLLAKDDNYV
ncbi:conserved hypothetical protein [Beggiatoa sp. PS]|nr:conserved hypothetical protein [Beggiatoa sp. PS]